MSSDVEYLLNAEGGNQRSQLRTKRPSTRVPRHLPTELSTTSVVETTETAENRSANHDHIVPRRELIRRTSDEGGYHGRLAQQSGPIRVTQTRSEDPSAWPVSTRSKLWALAARHRRATATVAAASSAGGICEAAFLVIAARSVIATADGRPRVDLGLGLNTSIVGALVLSVILVGFRVALGILAGAAAARATVSVGAQLRRELGSLYMSASWSIQQETPPGRLQELLTNYASRSSDAIAGLTSSLTAAMNTLALLAASVWVDPLTTGAVLALLLVLGMALRPARRRLRWRSQEMADAGMNFASMAGEVSRLGLEIQAMGVQRASAERMGAVVDEGARAARRAYFLRNSIPVLFSGVAYIAIIAGIAGIAAAGPARAASVGAVLIVMLRSLSYGQAIQVGLSTAVTSLPYLEEFERECVNYRESQQSVGRLAIGSVERVEFSNVSFSYLPDRPALRSVNIVILRGEVLGIVGPSGGGKSTLVQLLLGLREPTDGSILVNGIELSSLDRSEWSRRVSFVPQQARLMRGSVADNIRFLRSGLTESDVVRAARLAHIHDEIEALPGAYDCLIGSEGSRLSGGQQQRLSIARALVGSPDLIVLDEPTSALDGFSEEQIRNTLSKLARQVGIVMIAHRPSTLEICNRIAVVEDGQVSCDGDRAWVVKESSFFGKMTS